MLDTVRLRSPFIGFDTALEIEQSLTRRSSIRIATGEKLWEFTTGELEGSFDNRISVQVKREEIIPVKGGAVSRQCDPYLVVEGSVHKALLGHNITGGPQSIYPAVCWFLQLISGLLGADLPPAGEWEVRRVDWAECYRLPYEAIEEYIGALNNAVYPRRKVIRYGREAVFSPGTTTTVKIYHKGPEFSVHDLRRVRNVMVVDRVVELQQLANEVMRIETSIKAKKLGADSADKPLVATLRDGYIQAIHDHEVGRLLKEGRAEMEIVRTRKAVKDRLYSSYTSRQATALFATWMQLAGLGEDEVKREMTKPTFYRHRKQLIEAGCSWTGADVHFGKSAIPADFSLSRNSPYRMSEEDPEVSRQLERYRAAA